MAQVVEGSHVVRDPRSLKCRAELLGEDMFPVHRAAFLAAEHPVIRDTGQPGPGASLPAKAKAYGRYCQTQSKKHVAGQKGTP
jgi:hypothetical protein